MNGPSLRARTTVYRGVRMRSRLEAGFAAWLDERWMPWEYEPCAFGGRDGQYLPDFRVDGVVCSWLPSPQRIYVEVKPESWEHDQALVRRMQIVRESEPEAVLVIARQGHVIGSNRWPFAAVRVIGYEPGQAECALWCHSCHPEPVSVGLSKPLIMDDGPWANAYWEGPPD